MALGCVNTAPFLQKLLSSRNSLPWGVGDESALGLPQVHETEWADPLGHLSVPWYAGVAEVEGADSSQLILNDATTKFIITVTTLYVGFFSRKGLRLA